MMTSATRREGPSAAGRRGGGRARASRAATGPTRRRRRGRQQATVEERSARFDVWVKPRDGLDLAFPGIVEPTKVRRATSRYIGFVWGPRPRCAGMRPPAQPRTHRCRSVGARTYSGIRCRALRGAARDPGSPSRARPSYFHDSQKQRARDQRAPAGLNTRRSSGSARACRGTAAGGAN